MKLRKHVKPVVELMLSCNGEYVEESLVETSDIAENELGQDIVTFKCPACFQTHTSRRHLNYSTKGVRS